LLPFTAISLLGLFSLQWPPTANTLLYPAQIAALWLIYLYLINKRPNLTIAIAAVLLIQGTVAIAQFYLQHEIGLEWLGEPALDLGVEGTSVLWARGRNWLRSYGLTGHPNVLGAVLCTCLLLYLPQFRKWPDLPPSRQILFLIVILAGITGLFLSFSRTAWLAFAAGLLSWFLLSRLQPPRHLLDRSTTKRQPHKPRALLVGLLLILPTLWLFVTYYDLAFSRFVNLESDIEAKSISERVVSAETALHLITNHPWLGVGLGRFVAAAQAIDPDAGRVHNVPLLVAAELGIIGLLLWLWLMLAPFWRWLRPMSGMRLSPTQLAPWAAMIVLNLFDTTLWFGENWQTAVLFIVLAAHLVWPVNEFSTSPRQGP
jgi:O-antigen ligase